MKVWYDGTITFRLGNYFGSVKLDVTHAEISVNLELDAEDFAEYGVKISDAWLMYLANELNAHIEAVAFFVPFEVGAQCLCLKKCFIYSSERGALKALIQAVQEISIVADAVLRIALEFSYPNIPSDFYEQIENEINKATYEHLVQRLPSVKILLVDDLFNPNLMSLKFFFRTRLPQCKIFVADKDLNPIGMMGSLKNQLQENKIDIVIGYGNGCFFAHQLTNIPKILIQPKFGFSDELASHIEELNSESSESMPDDVDSYRFFAIESCKDMVDEQFMTIRNEDIENTIGFFWTDNTEENGELFTEYYGPIQQLFTEFGVINDDAIRYKIIPAIDALYAKTHRPSYMSDVSRGEFAEHLHSIIQDHITYPRPELYGEKSYIKVCLNTNDITMEHGYQAFLLEKAERDKSIVPDEDAIRFLALQRYPDSRVSEFIDRVVSITEAYRRNFAMNDTDMINRDFIRNPSEMLLVIHKDDLSMEVRFKNEYVGAPKSKTEEIYPFSRFMQKDAQFKNLDINFIKLTKLALKYIQVEGFRC